MEKAPQSIGLRLPPDDLAAVDAKRKNQECPARGHPPPRRDRAEGEIVTPLVEPTDLELIRKIAAAGR